MSKFNDARNESILRNLQELRSLVTGSDTNADRALYDRLSLEDHKLGSIGNETKVQFEGILEKLRESNHVKKSSILEEKKVKFVAMNQEMNKAPDFASEPPSLNAIQLLLLLGNSPSSYGENSKNDLYTTTENEINEPSRESEDDEIRSESSPAEQFDHWLETFDNDNDLESRGSNDTDWLNSDDEDFFDEIISTQKQETKLNESGISGNGVNYNYNSTGIDGDFEIDGDIENYSTYTFEQGLEYGAHISNYKMDDDWIEIISDKVVELMSNTEVSVCLEFDACKMITEILLGSPNDLFDIETFDWRQIFSLDAHISRNAHNIHHLNLFDIKHMKVFRLTNYAKCVRLNTLGSTGLNHYLEWFSNLASDIYICRQFATTFDLKGPSQLQIADHSIRKLVEGLRAQVLEFLNEIDFEIMEYQKSFLHECGDLFEEFNINSDKEYERIATPKNRCSMISLYSLSRKWTSTLQSMISFIQTLLNFMRFHWHKYSTKGYQAKNRSEISSSGNLPYELYLTFKMIENIQDGVQANNLNLGISSVSPFTFYRGEKKIREPFKVRRRYYEEKLQGNDDKKNILRSYALFERFIFTHMMHFFVETCCIKGTIENDENFFSNSNDIAKHKFLLTENGGLMKQILPYLVLLDSCYGQVNRTIWKFSKTNSSNSMDWKKEIEHINSMIDYKHRVPKVHQIVGSDRYTSRKKYGTCPYDEKSNARNDLFLIDNSRKKEQIDEYSYDHEIANAFKTLKSRDGDQTKKHLLIKDQTTDYSISLQSQIVPTICIHKSILIDSIIFAKQDIQIAVIEGIWDQFCVDEYLHFFCSIFMMKNDELFIYMEQMVSKVFEFKCIRDLEVHSSNMLNNLATSMTSQFISMSPSFGILHLSVAILEIKSLTTTSRCQFLSNIVNNLSIQLHLKYPLGRIFTENAMEKYQSVFHFLMRLAVSEWILKTVWKERSLKTANKQSNINIAVDDTAEECYELKSLVMEAPSWYSKIKIYRIALNLLLRIHTDMRSYYLTLTHATVWDKFKKALYSDNGTYLNVASVTEARDCHGCMLESLDNSFKQFNVELEKFMHCSSTFAEYLNDSMKSEVDLQNYLYCCSTKMHQSKTVDSASLLVYKQNATKQLQVLENQLRKTELACNVMRKKLHQNEKRMVIGSSFHELKNLLG